MRFIALCTVSCLLGTAGGAGIVRGQTPAPAPTPASVAKAEQVLLEARKALGADKLSAFKNYLESQNYKVKNLGTNEGLTSAVPDDASVVIIAAPEKPFLAEEEASIATYLQKGGRLLVIGFICNFFVKAVNARYHMKANDPRAHDALGAAPAGARA